MCKRLVVGYSFLVDPHFRVMLEEAERAIASGDEVVFAYCDGIGRVCAGNRFMSAFQCAKCRFFNHRFIKRFSGRARVVPFYCAKSPKSICFDYKTMEDIKKITYKGVNVGYGAFSFYSFWSRDLLEEMTDTKREYIDSLLSEACQYTDCALNIIESEKPDAISVYNGRFLETRPFFELAKSKAIPVRINEVVLDDSDVARKEFKLFYYENALPQDIAENTRLLKSLWKLDSMSRSQKSLLAEDFFISRRGGKPTTDSFNPAAATTYLKYQIAGSLPESFDPNQRNIVIFNSSEDEYISIDPNFESFALYKKQFDGIRAVLDAAKSIDNVHVYLRIHPNLAEVKYPYHTNLYDLSNEYDFLTVIGATEPYSSYALMDIADTIVVFGSTIGAEATYWGKPVIQLGSSLYSLLDIAYRPKSYLELQVLLKSSLPPKSKEAAIQYGYYMCGRAELASKGKYVDMGFILWRGWNVATWPRLFGSAILMHRVRLFLNFPIKETLSRLLSLSWLHLSGKGK